MPKKPAERRQNRATKDVGVLEALGDVEVPAPARGKLLASTTKAWKVFWATEVAQLVTPADRMALDRLFRMYDMRERMERAFLAMPFTVGSTGQIVAHPASKEVASLDGRILALEDRFGITPAARLKLGITLGLAKKSLEDMNNAFVDSEPDEDDPRLRGDIIDID